MLGMVAAVLIALVFPASVLAQATVEMTSLGSHDWEFCRLDRAPVFEDPDGTRLLYDAGRTVAGAGDPRRGRIDAVLVSHMHGDRVGDRHIETVNAAGFGMPAFPVAVPTVTNTANIAIARQAAIVTGSEMPRFFAAKLQANGGDKAKSQRAGRVLVR